MPKNKRYKTYPFPFLADYTKDYKKTKFQLNVHYTKEQDKVRFQIDYIIDNQQIIDLINEAVLSVAVKITCRKLGFSKTYEIFEKINTIDISFDPMRFDGDVEFKAFLVAKKEFTLTNQDLSNEWINEKPRVQENNIIGESNEKVITITHLKSGLSKSIFKFTVSRSKEDDAPFSVNLNDDCIVFVLSQKTYRQFESVRLKRKDVIYVTYIIPAIADILRQMIEEKVPDGQEKEPNVFNIKNQNKRWYIVLTEKYLKAFNGVDPTTGAIPPMEAAQAIIDKYAVGNMLALAKRS